MIRFKRNRFYGAGTAIAFSILPAPVVAQDNASGCDLSRKQVLNDIKEGLTGEQLSKKYASCLHSQPASNPQTAFDNDDHSKGISITETGDTTFEAITSCGYHPQRKELTCPIEIRQQWGFGGPPALQPAGSYEYVQFCVNYGAGYVPVNVNGVHVHDEANGTPPNWYMTAVVAADETLFSQPLVGQTLKARAILSWALPPGGNCNFAPPWGNQADFRIRLDP